MNRFCTILFLLLFVKSHAQNNIKPELLQGKWQALDDSNSYLLIYKNYMFDFHESSKIWQANEFVLTSNCLNKYDYDPSRVSISNGYITNLNGDMCFSISELNQNNLELTYLARGNSLRYKRVLDNKYFPLLNLNDYLPFKDTIVFLQGKRMVNRDYVYLHNDPNLESVTKVYINSSAIVYCDKYSKGFAYCYYDVQHDDSEGSSLDGNLKGWVLESALGARLTTDGVAGYYSNNNGFSIEITDIDELDQGALFTANLAVRNYTVSKSLISLSPSIEGYTFKSDFNFTQNDYPLKLRAVILNNEGVIKGTASYNGSMFDFSISKQTKGTELIEETNANDINKINDGTAKDSTKEVNYTIEEEPFDVFTSVEEMPEFPGGMTALSAFIQKNLQFPQKAIDAGLSGKCFLKFIINKDGSVSNITVLKPFPNCKECDEEAVRIIKSMPKWKPGKQNGKTVRVYFNLPINFK